jgi:hypothetical protein
VKALICLLLGHKWENREGGKRGTWWARWQECARCEGLREYRYDYQAGDPVCGAKAFDRMARPASPADAPEKETRE